MNRYFIKTFGCQMNVHDSEKMAGALEENRCLAVSSPSDADIIILNTCSIREKAEQKFYSCLGRLRKLKRSNPSIKIVVTGCIAQQESEQILRRAPYVDHVIGPQNISRIPEVLKNSSTSVLTTENPSVVHSEMPTKRDSRVRAWVNIMYGCDNFCSYCIVPFTRGREMSRPMMDVISEIKLLSERGYVEVTLLGQNVNSYRADVDFPGLLRAINRINGIKRIRFMTSHPRDLSPELILAISECDAVCEHLHLPLQSGSDEILRKMNRRYTFDEYLEKVETLRNLIPGIAITSDIIAGFPSETDHDHACTLDALRRVQFDGIFAFQFSPRPKTAAFRMDDQVSPSIRSKRLAEILSVQEEITIKKNEGLVGHIVEVLIDFDPSTGQLVGRTRTNKIVILPFDTVAIGSLVDVRIRRAYQHSLEGVICA